jgi:hypothetical protein
MTRYSVCRRSLSDVQKASEILRVLALPSLGHGRRDRSGSPPHLRRLPVALVVRKASGLSIELEHERMAALPDLEIGEPMHC